MALLQSGNGTIYAATYGGGLNIIEKGKLHANDLKISTLTTETV